MWTITKEADDEMKMGAAMACALIEKYELTTNHALGIMMQMWYCVASEYFKNLKQEAIAPLAYWRRAMTGGVMQALAPVIAKLPAKYRDDAEKVVSLEIDSLNI